jgi:hypothetical protein
MKANELLDRLHSLDSDLRRCLKLRDETDKERELGSPRPDTEDWKHQAQKVVIWYETVQVELSELRPIVARFIGEKPRPWTPKEMMTLVTEKLAKL